MSAHEKFWDTPELLEEILVRLGRKDIVLSIRVCKRFQVAINASTSLQSAAFGAGLERLLPLYRQLFTFSYLEASDQLLLIDDITHLGAIDRKNGYWKVGLSLVTTLTLPRLTPSGEAKPIYMIAMAKQQPGRSYLSEDGQAVFRKEIDAAFPSSPVPVDLELAIITNRQVGTQEDPVQQVVYRVLVSLKPVPFGILFHVLKAIKQALQLPHRRKEGKLNLTADFASVVGLGADQLTFLRDTPTYVQEHWKI
ncbi:hypothetical protein M409DRAFT_54064 [Zasmidium cellare ATCC 36951]|uniref:F-box domain-containing protein n=1 Tax=Zasmidium cellare ATCC 36951 TaxID=1080233 RepID=A0A6A6CPS0_ZASCE|nr:uncharacterized protein M409DRAFT_54064 [Zasmidium cellare ATCC 36951]KAF2167466.1 hypothetical protein M409DRAFT_54064 [Zasmidium cellare ATCC 36951]